MGISNFHTHTHLCRHAHGSVQDMIAQAVKDDCSALGFSDHCPYPDETWKSVRMTVQEAKGYIDAIGKAAKLVKFPVYAGFEAEYAPEYENWYRDFLLGELGADYLAYGSHWVWDEQSNEYTYIVHVTDKKKIIEYTNLTIRGLQTGLYAFLAHPDLPMAERPEWSKEIETCFSAIIDAAVECNVPLEINGLGLARQKIETPKGLRYQYPVDDFWLMAKEKGAKIICNSDAHIPADIIKNAQNARNYANSLGLSIIENPFTKE
ncbi:MAG: histidinol-phosphatase [Treponemataceae bacterium]